MRGERAVQLFLTFDVLTPKVQAENGGSEDQEPDHGCWDNKRTINNQYVTWSSADKR